MLNNIHNFNYGEARYLILKEIDTQGNIGRILISIIPNLSLTMIRAVEQIDALSVWNPGDPENNLIISNDTINMFVTMQSVFPTLILTEDNLPWNNFMSAWCALANEFCSKYEGFANYKLAQNPNDPMARDILRHIETIGHTLEPIMRLAQIGAGYTELLKASAEMVKELKSWRQSRPSSLRLSQAYLTSLGLYKEEGPSEPESGNNPPPPPPPPVGDCDGNNPPPPPPPPPMD